jgi:integrase
MRDKPNGDHRAYRKTRTPGIYKRGMVSAEYYVVRFKDAGGNRREERAETMAEARDLLASRRAEVKAGRYRKIQPVTFNEYADKWSARSVGASGRVLRGPTREEYTRQLARAVAFLGGSTGRRPLASTTADDVAAYIDHLYATPFKRATVQRYMVPLKSMLTGAVRDHHIAGNPALGVPMLPTDPVLLAALEEDESDEGEVMALTLDELRALVAAVPDDQRLLVTTIAQTGLRIGETLGLRWQDFDAEERRLHFHQSVRNGVIGKPKSKRSRRVIPIGRDLVQSLREHYMASSFKGDADLVFPAETGKPAHASNHYRWFKTAAKEAGVEWAAFHTLRHTAASRWIHTGTHIAVVSSLLGHANPGFTMKVYVHILTDDLPEGDDLASAVGL